MRQATSHSPTTAPRHLRRRRASLYTITGRPLDVEAQRDKEILDEWHRHPGLGPSQIRNQLRAKCVKVSPWFHSPAAVERPVAACAEDTGP